jgi:hypothetical protein
MVGNRVVKQLEQIKREYTTPGHPIAFVGRVKLKEYYNHLTEEDIDEILKSNFSYGLHRETKRVPTRNPYYIIRPRQMIQIDLIQMGKWGGVHLPSVNDNINYLFIAIDCFSRKIWLMKLVSKNEKSSLFAMREVIEAIEQTPPFKKIETILFDKGTEFTNKKVQNFLKKKNITIIHPKTEIKAGIVERVNRTIQSLIYRYMTEHETNRYVDVLQDLVDTYNTRQHRSLGKLSPFEADLEENKGLVLQHQLNRFAILSNKNREIPKFKVGDIVRVKNTNKNIFRRGYHHNFQHEYFQVAKVYEHMAIRMYLVQSMNDKRLLKQKFYADQLQPIIGNIWRIEKVLKTRKRNRKKQLLVKWCHFDDTHNQWIDEDQVTNDFNND